MGPHAFFRPSDLDPSPGTVAFEIVHLRQKFQTISAMEPAEKLKKKKIDPGDSDSIDLHWYFVMFHK